MPEEVNRPPVEKIPAFLESACRNFREAMLSHDCEIIMEQRGFTIEIEVTTGTLTPDNIEGIIAELTRDGKLSGVIVNVDHMRGEITIKPKVQNIN